MLLHGSAVLLLAALALPSRISAQIPQAAATGVPLVDVPFVPQSEALCGGAAVAMVLRFWGERDVQAEQFASLVVDSGEGILTTDLTAAVRARGWQAHPFAGTGDVVRAQLARGWPVIALIEDRPGRYHYVVITAWANERVVFHDPARGPARIAGEDAFNGAWQAADEWALLVLPVREAEGGRGAEAEGGRSAEAGPAGIAFREGRYDEAAALARAVVVRAPEDGYAWQVLASSRYMLGDDAGALDAWNQMGRPINDLTRIEGLRRTRYNVIARAVDVAPGARITNAGLAHARRRVASLPGVATARVDYRPVEGGRAEVHAAILERPVFARTLPHVVAHAARAALEQRVRVEIGNAAGAAELWHGEAVWQRARRSTELGVALPQAFGTRWVWDVRAGERRLTHAPPRATATAAAITVVATHRRAFLGASDWASGWLRWNAGISYDEWPDDGAFAGVTAGVEVRIRERAAWRADVERWLDGATAGFGRARVRSALRSPDVHRGLEWQLDGGLQYAAARAPRDLWSGAGSGPIAEAPLRAHALFDSEGVISGRWFAPQLAHASAEVRWWMYGAGPLRLGVAAFADAAAGRGDPARPRTGGALDAGFGLRADVPGMPGALRLDVAWGVADGARALSLGWSRPWPGW